MQMKYKFGSYYVSLLSVYWCHVTVEYVMPDGLVVMCVLRYEWETFVEQTVRCVVCGGWETFVEQTAICVVCDGWETFVEQTARCVVCGG